MGGESGGGVAGGVLSEKESMDWGILYPQVSMAMLSIPTIPLCP